MAYEPFYEMHSAHDTATSRKRRNSNQESPEKRQRVDDDDDGGFLVTPGFAERMSQTAVLRGNDMVQFNGNSLLSEGLEGFGQHTVAADAVQYDPYYNMRILSLSILESLVRRRPSIW